MTLRRCLDALYDAAGLLAALFLVGTLAMVLTGIAGRFFHFHVPGTDAYAGYCMAGCGFLALAHTFTRGEHIRVTLLLEHSGGLAHRGLVLAALAIGTLLAGLFAFYSIRLAFQSWQFNDISTANDATPLWIPQLTMAFGTLVFAIALGDELARTALGRASAKAPGQPAHTE